MDLISKDKGITKKPEEIYEEEVNKTREKVWYFIFDYLFWAILQNYCSDTLFYSKSNFLSMKVIFTFSQIYNLCTKINLFFAPALLLIFQSQLFYLFVASNFFNTSFDIGPCPLPTFSFFARLTELAFLLMTFLFVSLANIFHQVESFWGF